ncbi:glycoside hydrolase family 1 protein [Medicago truncatula]|uniref:Glycoside hydrolase family 1 protein n=2 Tax=Medicago truncatula TaxID=3880 RepID=A0A072V6Z1_MEDTR|nr:glycoside hydrolase family 1 protein [Medicago truncatula]
MACSSIPIMAAVVTPATTTLVHHSFLNQRSFSTGLNKCWIGPRFSELKMAATVIPTTYDDDSSDLSRSSFPKGFVFGTASSAYQYEGAVNEDGRGKSNWDKIAHEPGNIKDGKNADVAVDHYHRYKEDVAIMKYMNTDAYRFSISWARILPKGKLSGGKNKEGIRFYNNLINELLDNGLVPYVTLFHSDFPQTLLDEYGGFHSPYIVDDFKSFVEVCFEEFGDRVNHWITLNEPYFYSTSTKYPLVAAQNLLLAHAAAVKLYKTNYQASQKGIIGITLNCTWFLPQSDNPLDHQAAERALDLLLGWFLQPLTTGEYPASMVSNLETLPKFTKEQYESLIGSYDFIGINYYTSTYAVNKPPQEKNLYPTSNDDLYRAMHYTATSERADGTPIGPKFGSWLYVYPKGIQELLLYIKKKYNNPVIYITENGLNEYDDPTLSLEETLMDIYRIDYHYRHLYYVASAIRQGVNVQGYFAWSLFDNFEWQDGYTLRFGINFVDFKNNLKRYPKLSARWFRKFLEKP